LVSILERNGIIECWHDRQLTPGQDWNLGIKAEMEAAQLILLLVSPDFLASDYIHDVEIKHALERHKHGTARVIPIILRPCNWVLTSLAKLQALPKNAKAVTSWPDIDEALLDVAKGIQRAAEEIKTLGSVACEPLDRGASTKAVYTTAEQDWRECQSEDGVRSVAASTRLIESGTLPANKLALAYNARACALAGLSRFQEALSDISAAISCAPETQHSM
jgi:hypothetical protein